VCFKWAGVKSQLRALEELSHRVDTIVSASTADDILKVRRLDTHATMREAILGGSFTLWSPVDLSHDRSEAPLGTVTYSNTLQFTHRA
jgi:hypothetical protein